MDLSPSANAIVSQLKKAGIEFIVNLPDRTTSAIVDLASQEPSMKVILVGKEDEGVSICGALSYGNRRGVLVMQHTGFLDSVNSVMAFGSELHRPVIMIIGLLEKEPGVAPTQSEKFGIKVTEPILNILEIPHILVERRGDEDSIAELINTAYATSHPLAIVVGTEVAAQ
jgi:sulfopyruvate decarboxylase TPP-binding subunit